MPVLAMTCLVLAIWTTANKSSTIQKSRGQVVLFIWTCVSNTCWKLLTQSVCGLIVVYYPDGHFLTLHRFSQGLFGLSLVHCPLNVYRDVIQVSECFVATALVVVISVKYINNAFAPMPSVDPTSKIPVCHFANGVHWSQCELFAIWVKGRRMSVNINQYVPYIMRCDKDKNSLTFGEDNTQYP